LLDRTPRNSATQNDKPTEGGHNTHHFRPTAIPVSPSIRKFPMTRTVFVFASWSLANYCPDSVPLMHNERPQRPETYIVPFRESHFQSTAYNKQQFLDLEPSYHSSPQTPLDNAEITRFACVGVNMTESMVACILHCRSLTMT
jgi:hypothetical protein